MPRAVFSAVASCWSVGRVQRPPVPRGDGAGREEQQDGPARVGLRPRAGEAPHDAWLPGRAQAEGARRTGGRGGRGGNRPRGALWENREGFGGRGHHADLSRETPRFSGPSGECVSPRTRPAREPVCDVPSVRPPYSAAPCDPGRRQRTAPPRPPRSSGRRPATASTAAHAQPGVRWRHREFLAHRLRHRCRPRRPTTPGRVRPSRGQGKPHDRERAGSADDHRAPRGACRPGPPSHPQSA